MNPRTRLALMALLSISLCACEPTAEKADPDGGVLVTTDQDGDCILDTVELGSMASQPFDSDGDGTPDYLDEDSDDDSVPDRREVGSDCALPRDSDQDGVPDYRDQDSDGNGIPDRNEGLDDLDGDLVPDLADTDDDGDGLPDAYELGDPAQPLDSDDDQAPDYRDLDSDGDTIADRDELSHDGDDLPPYRDEDSDGDGILDRDEAGDDMLDTLPVDTDSDGRPDYVDLDSDNDGLADGAEDANHDGLRDGNESDRLDGDSDDDGASDLIESAAGTSPLDPLDNPPANGDFVFIVPFQAPPAPTRSAVDFTTEVDQADVFFLMDTTGSMAEEISVLQYSLVGFILPSLAIEIPSVALGAGSYRDFPTSDYGNRGDQPFRLEHRLMTVGLISGLSSVQSAMDAWVADGGGDGPESSWEALYQVATGAGTTQGSASVPAFNDATAYPASQVAGEALGHQPGVGFRAGSLPLVVLITDAPGHNSDTPGLPPADYSGFTSARSTQAIAALNAIGARVIGITSGTNPDARTDQRAAVTGTGAWVPPSAWGAAGARPSGCAEGACCTGLAGAGEAPDSSGNCPLSFLAPSSGSGLDTAIVTGIRTLTAHGTMDVSASAKDDGADAVDAVESFVERLVASPAAGAPCDGGSTSVDSNGDGFPDTYIDLVPGRRVCFDIVPKTNVSVPATAAPQMFKATIAVVGDNVARLDTRDIYFLVPPEIPDFPVD